MAPHPRFDRSPDKRRLPIADDADDKPDPTISDVDRDEDQTWNDWINDDTGTKKVPLPPRAPTEQPGLHIPPPEEEYDPERDRRWREDRKDPDDPDSVPRGVWEMKQ